MSESPTQHRLAYLDVLRGAAALAVALYHLGNQAGVATTGFFRFSHEVLNLGAYGVLLFFVISGFIIPASLERHGSVAQFWISRVFRLGPLFWVVSLIVLGLGAAGLLTVSPYVTLNWPGALLGNVTILARHLGAPFLIGPAWTLPYEICFYLLTTLLFVTRLRGRSVAVALAAAALALIAADSLVPRAAVTPWVLGIPDYHGAPLLVAGLALGLAAVGALLSRSVGTAIYAALAAIVLVPVFLNRPDSLHQAVIYLAVMLTGTVVHRIWAGTLSPVRGWTVVAIVALACCGSFARYSETWRGAGGLLGESAWTRSVALLAAFGTFVLAYALRERVRWPRVLGWLGRISYSVYLTHWVVMQVVPVLPGPPVLTIAVWLAVTLLVSEVTYRLVELPSIALGRRVARRWKARSGDVGAAPAPDRELARTP